MPQSTLAQLMAASFAAHAADYHAEGTAATILATELGQAITARATAQDSRDTAAAAIPSAPDLTDMLARACVTLGFVRGETVAPTTVDAFLDLAENTRKAFSRGRGRAPLPGSEGSTRSAFLRADFPEGRVTRTREVAAESLDALRAHVTALEEATLPNEAPARALAAAEARLAEADEELLFIRDRGRAYLAHLQAVTA